MRIPTRKSRKLVRFVLLTCCSVLVFSGVVHYETVLRKNRTELTKLRVSSESARKEVYVTKKAMKAGDLLTSDVLEKKEIITQLDENAYLAAKDLGGMLLIDLTAGIPVMQVMGSKEAVEDDLREEECLSFYLSSNLKDKDIVDIRLRYPNGEDFVVLSKKMLRELNLGENKCFLWLNEAEILRISGAIVDAFLHEGTKLYTVKYVEHQIQEASIADYVPPKAVIQRMADDPNLIGQAKAEINRKIREELEQRLVDFYGEHSNADLSSMNENQERTSMEEETEEEEIHYVD